MGLREDDSIVKHGTSFATDWQAYGFEQMPFVSHLQYAMLYMPPHWTQLLSRLENFLSSDNRLLLLSGEHQVGKTTFINQFINASVQTHKRALVSGNKGLLPADLYQDLLSQLGLHANEGSAVEQFSSIIDCIANQRKSTVLIVDDAMLLPITTLAALLHLVVSCPAHLDLHVILVGDKTLNDKVVTLLARDTGSLFIQRLSLEPFSAREAKKYLWYRLKKAGLNAGYALHDSVVRQITQESKGSVGRLNERAQFYLEQGQLLRANHVVQSSVQQVVQPFQAIAANVWSKRWLQPLAMGFLLTFCFGVWHYQAAFNDSVVHRTHPDQPGLTAASSASALLKYLPMSKQGGATMLPASYTVELSASQDIGWLEALRSNRHLTQLTQIGHLHAHDQDAYVLTYGQYKDERAAEADLKKLPIALQSMHPHVRSVKNIDWTV